ncbi:hypothetical protein EDC01DRAFT_394688 [Geopyxis carbonaria]|nr:hypothetical protein EDC01DRAFT_394688 [Geopyxis carbonaria]
MTASANNYNYILGLPIISIVSTRTAAYANLIIDDWLQFIRLAVTALGLDYSGMLFIVATISSRSNSLFFYCLNTVTYKVVRSMSRDILSFHYGSTHNDTFVVLRGSSIYPRNYRAQVRINSKVTRRG